jgi:hypothetical protein
VSDLLLLLLLRRLLHLVMLAAHLAGLTVAAASARHHTLTLLASPCLQADMRQVCTCSYVRARAATTAKANLYNNGRLTCLCYCWRPAERCMQ